MSELATVLSTRVPEAAILTARAWVIKVASMPQAPLPKPAVGLWHLVSSILYVM